MLLSTLTPLGEREGQKVCVCARVRVCRGGNGGKYAAKVKKRNKEARLPLQRKKYTYILKPLPKLSPRLTKLSFVT